MEPNNKKLFIGGISHATNEDSLFEYFAKYGEVKKSEVFRDRVTGFSRGFGFVTFSEPASAEKALQDQQHVILGRTVEVTIPRPKYEKYGPNYYQHINNTETTGIDPQIRSSINLKKLFVGGLPSSLSSGKFKEYFDSFGTVTDSVIIYDKIYNKSRGFGFVTFDSEEAAYNVLRRIPHTLNEKVVDVKRAIPKEEISSNYVDNFSYVAGLPYAFDPYSHYYSFPSYSQCYYQATPYVLPYIMYKSSPLSNNASPYIRTEAYVNGHWIHEDVFNTYGSSSSSQVRSTPISCQRQRVRITAPSSCNNNAQGQVLSSEESNGSSFQNQQEKATQLRLEEQSLEVNVSAKDDVLSKESYCTQLSMDNDKLKGCNGEEIVVLKSNGAEEVLPDEESDCKSIQNQINDHVCLPKITTQLKLEDNIGVEEEQSPNVE